ncbi:LysR family transcriptional regulator [Caenimonas soli]|uniref:LysR family transcriptional regulator n=1 Tax=Caenimonas soli TaxID=2735555 RepID=UPI001553840D|nr:LysR family transcriptional regulator [Caenimonas soli]NPC55922.1 LysR family transcriptional regulator [Caenimonas soli]
MNINTLDLNLLVVFDAVQRTRSTTIAGEQIGVTQSAVSNALRRLREAFGDELFVRTEKGMMPTPLAQSMADPIQAALQQIRQTVEHRGSFDARESDRHFRLAISDMGQMGLLPLMLGHLQQVAPKVTIETVPLSRHGIAELMTSGDIDLAIGALNPLGAGFFRQRLRTSRFVCVARPDHPTISEVLTLEQFMTASFIEYHPTGGSYAVYAEHADRLFATQGATRRVAVKLAHLAGLDRMVACSDMLAVLPETLAQAFRQEVGLQVLELPFECPQINVTQQWHERYNRDPAQVWLRECVARLAGGTSVEAISAADSGHSHSSFDAARSAG